MTRRLNFQTVGWFIDLHRRGLLDLDPPYQRRSVWNQAFKEYFVDTVLLNYPAPAIFLYEEVTPSGTSTYHVVDGKQRLTALIEFAEGHFPIPDDTKTSHAPGQYFPSLDDDAKKRFWQYQFLVEYVPAADEGLITAIFDRLNRNTVELSAQELRHARFSGSFISAAEELVDWMNETLPNNFPRIAPQSQRQMKDVEFVALLLLLTEVGAHGYSQADLDEAFSARDTSWDDKNRVTTEFRSSISFISVAVSVAVRDFDALDLTATRLRNQADFYSLFGAVLRLRRETALPTADLVAQRLAAFVGRIDDEQERGKDKDLAAYFDAARSASNDKGPRELRIDYVAKVLSGTVP